MGLWQPHVRQWYLSAHRRPFSDYQSAILLVRMPGDETLLGQPHPYVGYFVADLGICQVRLTSTFTLLELRCTTSSNVGDSADHLALC
jgi:hypothetical protein